MTNKVQQAIRILDRAETDTDKIAAFLLLPKLLGDEELDVGQLQLLVEAVDVQMLVRMTDSDEVDESAAAESILNVLLTGNHLEIVTALHCCAGSGLLQRVERAVHEAHDYNILIQVSSVQVFLSLCSAYDWISLRPLITTITQHSDLTIRLLLIDVLSSRVIPGQIKSTENIVAALEPLLENFWYKKEACILRVMLEKLETLLDVLCTFESHDVSSAPVVERSLVQGIKHLVHAKSDATVKRLCVRLAASCMRSLGDGWWQADQSLLVLLTNVATIELRVIADQPTEMMGSNYADTCFISKSCVLLSQLIITVNTDDSIDDHHAFMISDRIHDICAFYAKYLAICHENSHILDWSVGRSLLLMLCSLIGQGGGQVIPPDILRPALNKMIDMIMCEFDMDTTSVLVGCLPQLDSHVIPTESLCALCVMMIEHDMPDDYWPHVATVVQSLKLSHCTHSQRLNELCVEYLPKAGTSDQCISSMCASATWLSSMPHSQSADHQIITTIARHLCVMATSPALSGTEDQPTGDSLQQIWLNCAHDVQQMVPSPTTDPVRPKSTDKVPGLLKKTYITLSSY